MNSTAQRDGWTPERISQLRRWWTDDGLTADEIAARFKFCTRSAVLGKVNRLGWQRGRPSAPTKFRAPPVKTSLQRDTVANANKTRPRVAAPKTKPLPAAPRVTRQFSKPWTERAFGECAYPIAGEGADTVSCCAPVARWTTPLNGYCTAHAAAMFVKAPKLSKPYAPLRKAA